jgi:hypothetical protein
MRWLSALPRYIHYNPVKLGLVSCVADWPLSSFQRYAKAGASTSDWGVAEPPRESVGVPV